MARKIKAPAAWAFKMKRAKKDFKVEFIRGSGPGGQHRNKVETGVRLTDLITGLSVAATDSRSQSDNMANAKDRLFDKMAEHYRKEYEISKLKEYSPETAIRSYKEKGAMVIDHRTGAKYNYHTVLNGDLNSLIEDLLLNQEKDLTN